MKHVLTLNSLVALTSIANAGWNGSYTKCVSASGRTVLTMGNLPDSAGKDTFQLSIYGKSIGQSVVDNEVFKKVEGSMSTYIEADSHATLFAKINMGQPNKKGISRAVLLDGFDPRTLAPLTTQIKLTCREIYNPI